MYLALYRKYRPRTFDYVISQEHITTTLKNQVKTGTTGHAYLFTGSRGTGKTTCAKILAMAVNCLDPKDGNPCLECERCREILDGSTTDIVEMDAASNNGVDDVRQLRDEVAYAPVSCKYRVYIIDEVHMLSSQAFNALLKTLEEPPPHVKFILATTELHKVLPTIQSRCQRFTFRRVNAADSAARLLETAEREGVALDPDAADLISRLSDGGMRDALSILDRCISEDKHVTSAVVRDCAGVVESKHLFAFSEMIANHDAAGCIRLLGELHMNTKDIAVTVSELSGHFRDLMLYKTAPDAVDLLSALPDEWAEIERICGMYTLEEILRCLTLLRRCADGIGKVKQRKIVAEMCLVQMCTGVSPTVENPAPKSAQTVRFVQEPKLPVVEIPDEQLTPVQRRNIQKTRELMAEYEKTGSAEENAPPIGEPPLIEEIPREPTAENAPEPTPNAELPPLTEITPEQWADAVSRCDVMVSNMFKDSDVSLDGRVLTVRSANEMLLNNAKDAELIRLNGIISKELGFSVSMKIERKEIPVDESELSPLEKALEKAREMGIEVKVTD